MERKLVSIHTRPRGRVTRLPGIPTRIDAVSIHTRPRGRVTRQYAWIPCPEKFQSTPARVGG